LEKVGHMSTALAHDASGTAAAEVRDELRRGSMNALGLLVGFAPFALVIGAATAAHPDPAAGWGATWAVYGGSAHLALLDLTRDGGLVVAVVTAAVINARLVIYSLALAPHWRSEPRWVRAAMAVTIVDPTFALAEPRYRESGSAAGKRGYYLGVAVTMWFGWMALISLGMVVGDRVPADAGLEIAVPICLASLVVPSLSDRSGRLAVLVAVAIAVAGSGLPAGTGLLAAIVAGAVAGGFSDSRRSGS
jgi:predicted branched-subunit amino acid permease